MQNPDHKSNYNSWTEYFQNDSLVKNAIRLEALIRSIERHAVSGSRLLEAGFGSGSTGILLHDMGYNVTLLDIEEGLMGLFRSRFPGYVGLGNIKLVHGDMYEPPFPDKAFDLVYHQGVLEHLTDDQIVRALRQQARIASLVVIDVPNSRYPDRPYGDERLLSIRTWLGFVRQAGLEVLEISGRRFPKWMYLLPRGFFLFPIVDYLNVGRWFGQVSIFVCQPVSDE